MDIVLKKSVYFIHMKIPQKNTKKNLSFHNFKELNLDGIKLADLSVPAGFPSPADDFIEMEINLQDYIVKNKEYSGDSKLAETKNMYISEILLANKIAEDFMSCSDQNSSIKYIRNSKNFNDVQMFKNGQLVKNLNGQFKIEENIIIEGNNKFISYLKFKKLKK